MERVTLHDRLVSVTQDYLGPAAHRFVDRQIEHHLNKQPHEIVPEDLETFINWARIAFALLTDNKRLVMEYGNRLAELVKDSTAMSK